MRISPRSIPVAGPELGDRDAIAAHAVPGGIDLVYEVMGTEMRSYHLLKSAGTVPVHGMHNGSIRRETKLDVLIERDQRIAHIHTVKIDLEIDIGRGEPRRWWRGVSDAFAFAGWRHTQKLSQKSPTR
ncbi:MAG: hypothetical protein O3C10_07905 [Chloroflexi bacterium]|nr:hypothetical protein [Chloroflexota bacterium]